LTRLRTFQVVYGAIFTEYLNFSSLPDIRQCAEFHFPGFLALRVSSVHLK
jgi:hypothetical protein